MDTNCSGNVLLPLWFYRIRVHALVHARTSVRQFHECLAHAIAQCALDFPTLLRKHGFVISMQCSSMLKKQPIAVIFEVICAKKLGKGPFISLDFQCDLQLLQNDLRPGSFSHTFIAIECENHSHRHKRELFHLIIVQL